MKKVIVVAAGLGFDDLERRGLLKMESLEFRPGASVFPAVTCVAQASFRTGTQPCSHGVVSNGFYNRALNKAMFWEQSSSLVSGARVWDAARAAGERVGLYFWQQSMGEDVDTLITPAPIHKHGGGIVMSNYTKPAGMSGLLARACGNFPLHRYWGPLASPKVGRHVLENFIAMTEAHETDTAIVYLPTLDYEAQRHGPGSKAADKALAEFRRQLRDLVGFCSASGASLTVFGDYAIGDVTLPPVAPNVLLRRNNFFNVRKIKNAAYPDLCMSRAFAMCDHEIAHVYVRHGEDVDAVAELFRSSGDYASVEIKSDQSWAHDNAGEILLVAKKGSWCAYHWWENRDEEPDYASHVDIHSKPGYDPCELFFGGFFPPRSSTDPLKVKGTHGRESKIAWASTDPSFSYDGIETVFRNLK